MRLKKRKAKNRIAARIRGYEEAIKGMSEQQKAGYHKPGSAKHW